MEAKSAENSRKPGTGKRGAQGAPHYNKPINSSRPKEETKTKTKNPKRYNEPFTP